MMKRINITNATVEEVKFNHFKNRYGKFFSLVEQGKSYLKKQIKSLGLKYESVLGWETKQWREKLKLVKTHGNDAIAIICQENKPIISSLYFYIKPKRARIYKNIVTKTCEEKNGFRHYDLVIAVHRTRGIVVGSIRSLKAKAITLRTKWDNNFPVSYSKTRLLQRFNGLVYNY